MHIDVRANSDFLRGVTASELVRTLTLMSTFEVVSQDRRVTLASEDEFDRTSDLNFTERAGEAAALTLSLSLVAFLKSSSLRSERDFKGTSSASAIVAEQQQHW
jgi:hypothetical protein